MRGSAPAGVIRASHLVPLRREAVFGVLCDLDRHRALTDHGMEILSLDGPPGRRTGGLVELRGPAGLRRRAHTRVRGAERGLRLWGSASTPRGTEAELEWTLRPRGAATEVEVRLTLVRGHWTDRLLLRFGGSAWLRRRLRAALARLTQLGA